MNKPQAHWNMPMSDELLESLRVAHPKKITAYCDTCGVPAIIHGVFMPVECVEVTRDEPTPYCPDCKRMIPLEYRKKNNG